MGRTRVLWAVMRKGRYPLEQVLSQRVRACQEAELALMRARGRVQDAELALEAATNACQAHAAKRSRLVLVTEQTSRSVPAQALAWSGAYAARLQTEGVELRERLKAAQAEVSAQARALRLAELCMQRAYSEREMLNRHHERFRETERKAAERAAELETDDLWHPAHRPQIRT